MAELALDDLERVASGIYLEGLAVDHERDIVWYSDVIAGGIHGVRPDGSPVVSFDEDRMWTGGVLLNDDGSVLSSGERGIRWNQPETGSSGWLLDGIQGGLGGVNEMVPDGTGGIFLGSIDIERVIEGGDPRPTGLYRLTVDGRLIELADIGFTNGIMFDPARKKLYCNDTFCCSWVFDVRDDLTLANRRLLLEKADADGMALDADGNVWITGFRSSFLTRVAPDGTELPRVDTPTGSITQVRFGGVDLRDCYFTSVPADGGDTLMEGRELTDRGSFLYRGRSEVPGRPVEPTRFELR